MGLPWWFSWSSIHLQWRIPWFDCWVGKIHWRRNRLPTPVFLGFPGGSAGKESACNVEGLGSILELGRSSGEGNDYPLQYSGLENSMDSTHAPWKKSYDQPRQHTKKQRHYFANIGPFSQRYGFSSSQVWMWELDLKEGWAHKNWCFCGLWCGEDSWESLDCKEIQPIHSKGDQLLGVLWKEWG